MKILVVGAGFAGSVIAERAASSGHSVEVIDRRRHIAGNAFDEYDAHGVLVHRYGPHAFHTNSDKVALYLSHFTDWIPYEHRTLAVVDGALYPIPINRTTINKLYGLNLDEEGVRQFLEGVREPRTTLRTSEDVVLASVGSDLCEKFFRNYTRKQWGLDLSELAPTVAARIPTRTNDDDRYFTDKFQNMPAKGYTAMFERMLDHPNIRVRLLTDFQSIRHKIKYDQLFFSGPIDEYFLHCFGKLPYRSLRFEHEHLPGQENFQPVAQVNYPNDHKYTRISESKHLTGQRHSGTTIAREYPESEGEPYYPVPRAENQQLYERYRDLATREHGVHFIGRLGQYRYFNMDQVVAQALSTAQNAGFMSPDHGVMTALQVHPPLATSERSVLKV
ncbi:MAG TPA: UDP-galactopyranose mutase [Terracidiphilus sp.]|jgi:UDP-galactopyranose mutase